MTGAAAAAAANHTTVSADLATWIRYFNTLETAMREFEVGLTQQHVVPMREIEIPVGYLRRGNAVTINVAAPDGKTWWRNFLGAGAELTLLDFHGADRTGQATATRSPKGRVKVTVQLG